MFLQLTSADIRETVCVSVCVCAQTGVLNIHIQTTAVDITVYLTNRRKQTKLLFKNHSSETRSVSPKCFHVTVPTSGNSYDGGKKESQETTES